MYPPSPFELSLAVGGVVLLVGGVIAYYRSSVTMNTTLVLVLLAVSCSLTGVTGVSATHVDANKIDYTVEERSPDSCHPEESTLNKYSEYSDLSPRAQEIFRSTLQADSTYTTTIRSDDLAFLEDTGAKNYIRYESTCYALSADSRRDFGTPFALLFYLGIAAVGGVFASASLFIRKSNEPTSILVGLVLAGGLTVTGITHLDQLAGVTALIGLLTWVVLRVSEYYSPEFQ